MVKKPIRIVLVSVISLVVLLYVALTTFSYRLPSSSWAVFMKDGKVSKIIDEPGHHFFIPSQKPLRLPGRELTTISKQELFTFGDEQYSVSFSISWQINDPEIFSNYFYNERTVSIFTGDYAISYTSDYINNQIEKRSDIIVEELKTVLNEILDDSTYDSDLTEKGIKIMDLKINFLYLNSGIDKQNTAAADEDIKAIINQTNKMERQFQKDTAK